MNINHEATEINQDYIKISSPIPTTVLVTGGTGFLGAYIIENLVKKGHHVIATQGKSQRPFFIPPEIIGKVDWVKGDILDVDFVHEVTKGIDNIIHTAALVSFSAKDRKLMYKINIDGTANVVNMALENSVKRFIHVSSVAAIGRTIKSEMIDETKKWDDAGNNTHYGITKHHSEINVWRGFAEGLEGNIINPSTILGYGNWHQSSCAIFRNAYKEFQWYTEGVNGFVGVEDVAEIAVELLYSEITQERFIINADNWSFHKLFDCIADHFYKKRPTREAGLLAGQIAWRLEKVKSLITGNPALLTKETAKVAQSKTSFSNQALLKAIPGFSFTPLDKVIENACQKYLDALKNGILTL